MNIRREDIPNSPGVYFFKNSRDEIIYIGKAKNLRNRVMSYFTSKHEESPKTKVLVSNISSYDFLVVDNEVESLLLENKLIKKHSPKYNINLKDAKTYSYIKITEDTIPQILTTRKVTNRGEYFGPYIDAKIRNELLFLVVDLFQLITPKTYSSKSKLYYEIGKAPGKNLKEINTAKYLKQVKRAKKFLRGENTAQIKRELTTKMNEASYAQQYELALYYKQKIDAIEYLKNKQKVDLVKHYDQDVIVSNYNEDYKKIFITLFHIGKGVISSKKDYSFDYDEGIFLEFIKIFYSKQTPPKEILVNEEFWEEENDKIILEQYLSKLRGSKVSLILPKKGEKKKLISLALKNSATNSNTHELLKQLQTQFSLLQFPSVIECFDMSNLGSQDVVGGMTRWVDGKPDKQGYRKFEIKTTKGKQDDFAAMRETIYRRYHRLKYYKEQFPDLIIIDGGKGQLNAGIKALNDLGVQISLLSIAKKEEEIFIPQKEDSIKLDSNSQLMLFLRNIRDSVHTYVLSYNRAKRTKRMRDDFTDLKKTT